MSADILLIGDWRFDARTGELSREGQRIGLEDRSARTLALLSAHPGHLLARTQIVERIWKDRLVSENSLAVVIGDLRRALGDEARAPRYIETVAKRGYRLIATVRSVAASNDGAAPVGPPEAAGAPVKAGTRRWLVLGAIIAAAIPSSLLWISRPERPRSITLAMGPIENDTGDVRFAPLALALRELVRDRVTGFPDTVLIDGAPPASQAVRLRSH